MSVKTDQMVQIMGIQENVERHGVNGKAFSLDNGMICFMPNKLEDKKARLRKARADEDYSLVSVIESEWIDLRSAFSQTINKSQGSTYDKVYIDLSDVARCNSGNQIARMLYVAISRARSQVFLTGDLA
jgi:ATP-dependent exoDNAse (exonuclease V) alpha subunit